MNNNFEFAIHKIKGHFPAAACAKVSTAIEIKQIDHRTCQWWMSAITCIPPKKIKFGLIAP